MMAEHVLGLIGICAVLFGILCIYSVATHLGGVTSKFAPSFAVAAWLFLCIVLGADLTRLFQLATGGWDRSAVAKMSSHFLVGLIPATIVVIYLEKTASRATALREAQAGLRELKIVKAFLRVCGAGSWNAEGVDRVLTNALGRAENTSYVPLDQMPTYWETSELLKEVIARVKTDPLFRLPAAPPVPSAQESSIAATVDPPTPTQRLPRTETKDTRHAARASFVEKRDQALEQLAALLHGVPDKRAALEAELREWEELARYVIR